VWQAVCAEGDVQRVRAQGERSEEAKARRVRIEVAAQVIDDVERDYLMQVVASGRYAAGLWTERFEREFAAWWGVRSCLLVNSGSSANLLAMSALMSPALGDRALKPGDEVITAACGFPTTVNPIVQNGLVPVFIDCELETYNAKLGALAAAVGPRTRAVILAHTLGNPFDAAHVAEFCHVRGLFFIEDCCDASGATWQGQKVGTFGDLATVSFYPAHHMSMGEGGAVLSGTRFRKIVESYRDWGRDCWCAPGCDDTCGKRLGWQLGSLPEGYDHKYTYAHRGYNLKATEFQAALGCAQLQKVDGFILQRRRNMAELWTMLDNAVSWLGLPTWSWPDWSPFGLPLRVLPGAPMTRDALCAYLWSHGIATRLLFAGNITRHPAYADVNYRMVGELRNSDEVMNSVFWVGVHPGLGVKELQYVAEALRETKPMAAVEIEHQDREATESPAPILAPG
jgi:CDP-6-deoxy-D-xylo-4-hexulose-3-dehydrase